MARRINYYVCGGDVQSELNPRSLLSGMQLPVEKKRGKFKGTTQVWSEAAETPREMIPTMVP